MHPNSSFYLQQGPGYDSMQQHGNNHMSPDRNRQANMTAYNYRTQPDYQKSPDIYPPCSINQGVNPAGGLPHHHARLNDHQNPQQVADDILQMASSQYMASGQGSVVTRYQHPADMNHDTPGCLSPHSTPHGMSSPNSQCTMSTSIHSPQSYSCMSPYSNTQFSPHSNISETFTQEQFHPPVEPDNAVQQSASNCNPLMSLQKLSMLPEHQVIDPKTVVNESCLSGPDCEANLTASPKNSNNPEPVKSLTMLSSTKGSENGQTGSTTVAGVAGEQTATVTAENEHQQATMSSESCAEHQKARGTTMEGDDRQQTILAADQCDEVQHTADKTEGSEGQQTEITRECRKDHPALPEHITSEELLECETEFDVLTESPETVINDKVDNDRSHADVKGKY